MAKTKKKEVFAETSGLFFGRVDGEDEKTKQERSSPKIQKIRKEPFRRFIAAYLSLKKGKGRGLSEMSLRAASGPRAVGGRPLY